VDTSPLRQTVPGSFALAATLHRMKKVFQSSGFKIAADELKLARGVIAGVGKAKEYSEMLKQTIDGAKS
jgi:hypothetical protein